MNFSTNNRLSSLILFIVLIWVIGCTPTFNASHPDAAAKIKTYKKYLLLNPDVEIYELSVGGITTLKPEWTENGKQNAKISLTNYFKDKLKLDIIQYDSTKTGELDKDNLTIFKRVSKDVNMLVINPDDPLFTFKKKNFIYSIGSVKSLLEAYGADGLILVNGYDEISTSGRIAAQTAAVILGSLANVQVTVQGGATYYNIAVVDDNGFVAWYSAMGERGGKDLRKLSDVSSITESMLKKSPLKK